ncbi:MAG: Ku protein [Planctomycetes bacterium]|nr:Ku protein [Planctomycetota bacterium]
MAARSSWKGFLRLSLVSIPVKAYTATSSGAEIHLNQIHVDCHSRIKYQKVCPIHGELSSDAIVSGYEFAKGQFVVIDPDELDKLRTESDKAIQIDSFIAPSSLDPAYFNGRTYYLLPDGPIGQKPYALLHQGMKELERVAIAQVVMHGKEQVVMVRPLDKLLAMSMLSFDSQVVKPTSFEEDAPTQEVSDAELDLVKMLIKGQTPKTFDFAKYQDVYTQKLTQLIEAKVEGKEIVSPPAHEEAQVINLMDALKQSVARVKQESGAEEEAAPPKKMAKSQPRKPAERKRKSS